MTRDSRRLWSCVAAVAWIAAAWCPTFGADGSTEVFTTGTYAAQDSAPDYLTTTDPQEGTLAVTYGTAAPVRPSDEGKVLIDWNLTSGPTAAFVLRTTGWGCAYTVYGVWVGPGGEGEPPTWYSAFDAGDSARIVLEVNEDGFDDDWVRVGGAGTLKVYVLGGPSVDYTVRLQATSGLRFNEEGGPSTIDVNVAGNGNEYQYTPVTLYGESEGQSTIQASCPYAPTAAGTNATVAVVAGWQYRSDPPTAVVFRSPWSADAFVEASAGEKLIFGIGAEDRDGRRPKDTGGDFQPFNARGPHTITFTCSAGAEWDARGSQLLEKPPVDGLQAYNVLLYIKNTWTGDADITVSAVVKDNAPAVQLPDVGHVKDANVVTVTWTIKKRGVRPKSLTRIAGAEPGVWVAAPAWFVYRGDPALPPAQRPHYHRQTVLEQFGVPRPLGFTMDDLTDDWREKNDNLNTPPRVAAALFSAGRNSTFVFDDQDRIADKHDGFADEKAIKAFKPAAWIDADGVGYILPQEYSCGGVPIGNATIARRQKFAPFYLGVSKTGP